MEQQQTNHAITNRTENVPVGVSSTGHSALKNLVRYLAMASMFFTTSVGLSQTQQTNTIDKSAPTNTAHLSDSDKQQFQQIYARMPACIRAFEKMDFDTRQVQEEYLCLKTHKNLFIDAVRYDLLTSDQEPWSPAVMMAMEIADLGRSSMTINPESPIREAAKMCGLKRICELLDFKQDKNNKGRYFLSEKDDFYRGGLNAEMMAFDGISHLFPLDSWLPFKKEFIAEIWHYDETHPENTGSRNNSYQQAIRQRAVQKYQAEENKRQLLAHNRY